MRRLLVIFFLLCAAPLEAAVTIPGSVSSGRRTGSSTSTLTVSHTTTSDTDMLVVAVCGVQPTMTGTFNGSSMLQPVANADFVGTVHWFVVFQPTATTANIVITPGSNTSLALTAWNIKGAGSYIAYDRIVDVFGGTGFTFTQRGQSDGFVLEAGCSDGNNQVFTAGGTQTVDVSQDSLADTSAKMAAGHLTPSGSGETMGYTFSVSDIATAAMFSLAATGSIPAGAPTDMAAVSYAAMPENAQTLTWLHPNRAQDNLIAIHCYGTNNDTTVSTITYDGVGLTGVNTGTNVIYSLASPHVGTLQFVMTASAAGRSWGCAAFSFRSDGIRNTAVSTGFALTLNVTTVSGDTVVDHYGAEPAIDANIAWTAGANQTKIFSVSVNKGNNGGSADLQHASSWEAATSTTTTMSWTIVPSNGWTMSKGVIAVKPSTVPYSNFNAQRMIKEAHQQ